MITVKQIEQCWGSRQYERLYRDLIAFRPEANLPVTPDAGWAAPAAAMAVIWLDDFSQSHAPLYPKLIKALIATQQPDGSWGDLVTTALCLRALLCCNGDGMAIQRGLAFLANLQKPEGCWPRVPHRRMPEDADVSVTVLAHLGDKEAFANAVRLDDAVAWFENNEPYLDVKTKAAWHRVARRCRRHAAPVLAEPAMWS